MSYEIKVNGRTLGVSASALKPLARVLREDLNLKGTKVGCSEGRCGSCTVLVDGEPIVSCLYPLGLLNGAEVTTVEGLAGKDGELSPLQAAFLDAGAVQCGICTPGMLMSLTAFLDANPTPTEQDVRAALTGNLCRCTGYQKIFDAVAAATEGRGE